MRGEVAPAARTAGRAFSTVQNAILSSQPPAVGRPIESGDPPDAIPDERILVDRIENRNSCSNVSPAFIFKPALCRLSGGPIIAHLTRSAAK